MLSKYDGIEEYFLEFVIVAKDANRIINEKIKEGFVFIEPIHIETTGHTIQMVKYKIKEESNVKEVD